MAKCLNCHNDFHGHGAVESAIKAHVMGVVAAKQGEKLDRLEAIAKENAELAKRIVAARRVRGW